ncbi:uncharacterized protein UHOD_11581 [Ustilago sp. UG-2017b]|nr:uncharacterized protein UHOD_11581 [Ustilago sp. UG-2017b]
MSPLLLALLLLLLVDEKTSCYFIIDRGHSHFIQVAKRTLFHFAPDSGTLPLAPSSLLCRAPTSSGWQTQYHHYFADLDTVMGLKAQVARRLLVRMAGVQSPWRPWTRRTRPIRKEVQAPPQGGPSSRSMQTVTTQGLKRQESKEPSPVKEKEQCIGNRQVGPEEEEQCRRSRHSSGGQEWC